MGLNLIGKIELDGAGFERGLHRAGESVTDFAKHAAIAAFGFYGVEESIRKTVETASDLVNESKRLDVTIDQLQILQQAAKDAGTDLDTIASAFEKIDLARAKALDGDKKALAAFAMLGVSVEQLKNNTAADIFTGSISNSVKNGSVEDLAPALKEVLGKGFGEVIPVLKSDFEDLGKELEKFGLKMDSDTAVKLKHMGDGFDLVAKIIAVLLGPALVKFATWLLQSFAHSKTLESTDFLAKRAAELAKLPDFKTRDGKTLTAEERDEAANDFRTYLNKAITDKTPWDKFKENFKYALTQGVFSDFKGNSFPEFRKYLSDISNPVIDANQKASKESDNDMSGIQKTVDDFIKRLEKEAYDLDHPKPPDHKSDDAKKQKKLPNRPEDALVKVGNFLGSNGTAISRMNQEKIALAKQHLGVLRSIDRKIGQGTFGTGVKNPVQFQGTFGLGVPIV